MENLTCVFCGHRDAPESLYTMVYHTAEELIVRQGVTQFYCGEKGLLIGSQPVRFTI